MNRIPIPNFNDLRISDTEWLYFLGKCNPRRGLIITTQGAGPWSFGIRIGQRLLRQTKTFNADTHAAIVDPTDGFYIYEMRAKGLERNPLCTLFIPGKTRRVRLWEPKFEFTTRAVCLATDWLEQQYDAKIEYGWLAVLSGGLLSIRGRRQCAQLVLDYTRRLAKHTDIIIEDDDFFTPAEISRYYKLVLEL